MRSEDVQNLLRTLITCADRLNRAQVKQLYRMLIAVGHFPLCAACHQPITDMNDFTWDHIWPASKGGNNDLINMQPMHCACNQSKGCELSDDCLEYEAELTVQIAVTPPHKKHKKRKNRNVQRYKASQASSMVFRGKGGRSR